MSKRLIVGAAAIVAVAFAPIAQADSGDQVSAEQAVRIIYGQVQRGCTPSTPPSLQSISWSRFYPASGGEGTIHDANPALGGPFQAYYTNPQVGPAQSSPPFRASGQWGVNLEFC